MAGRSDGNMQNPQNTGSNGNSRKETPALAQSGSLLAEEVTAIPNFDRHGSVHATLVIERGISAGKKFPLSSSDASIGRWDADGGVFPDVDLDSDDPEAKVSRRHARISLRDGNYLIEDLGSTNGTFVNRGRRLAPGDRQPLKDGDEIIVGKTFLRFRVAK
jgi:pSer/pThr/pTyr-binding forkhead associated (FHA) protein